MTEVKRGKVALGIALHRGLGLTGVCTDSGSAVATAAWQSGNKGLREAYSLVRDPSDGEEIIFSLLGGLQLENFPLMSGVEGLDDAMVGKVATKTSEKTMVKAIDKRVVCQNVVTWRI